MRLLWKILGMLFDMNLTICPSHAVKILLVPRVTSKRVTVVLSVAYLNMEDENKSDASEYDGSFINDGSITTSSWSDSDSDGSQRQPIAVKKVSTQQQQYVY